MTQKAAKGKRNQGNRIGAEYGTPQCAARPRLVERLNAGLHAGCKLTLVSAPAGYGKTSLLSEWLLAIARSYGARGGAVRVIEANTGVERYYEVRQRLAAGRS